VIMAFRSLVKNAVEKEKRRSSIARTSVRLKEDDEQDDPTAGLGLFFGVPARQKTYWWLEERLSRSPTFAGERKAEVDCVIETTLSCKGAPTFSPEVVSSNEQTVDCDPEYPVEDECPSPSSGLRTYKWAEARLSKSAALAGANWDNPEAYMDYVRKKHRHSPSERRKVAVPSAPQSDVVLPQEHPPSLEQPFFSESLQIEDTQQTSEGTVDSRPTSPTHKLETSKQAEAMAVTAAPPSGIDDSFPAPDAKPRSAWEEEKPPSKCNCVLM